MSPDRTPAAACPPCGYSGGQASLVMLAVVGALLAGTLVLHPMRTSDPTDEAVP